MRNAIIVPIIACIFVLAIGKGIADECVTTATADRCIGTKLALAGPPVSTKRTQPFVVPVQCQGGCYTTLANCQRNCRGDQSCLNSCDNAFGACIRSCR